MNLAIAASPQPARPVIGTYVDTEVGGMYEAELHAGTTVESAFPITSKEDALTGAAGLSSGDQPAMVVTKGAHGEYAISALDWHWKDLDSGAYSGPIEPATFEGAEDSILERAATDVVAIVDGETVLTPR
jgi:hypothetical protein